MTSRQSSVISRRLFISHLSSSKPTELLDADDVVKLAQLLKEFNGTAQTICEGAWLDASSAPQDAEGIGQETVTLLARGLASLESLAESTKQDTLVREEAYKALATFGKTLFVFVEQWPWLPGAEEVAEGEREHAAGESLPLEEAFAEIRGVDRPTWIRMVEDRRRQLEGKQ